MTWPTIFGNLLGGNQPLSLIDGMFQQTAQMLEIPCSASGATAISLTPLVNCPVLTGYTEFCAARFRATANSGAGVTAQINGLGFLNVYKADGVTQCGLNDLVINFEYVVRFSQALGGGVGGWFLEAPAVGSAGGGGGGITTPGGRLTLQASTPVMVSSIGATGIIYYAPYINQFVPIWNGSTLQVYNFCSSLSDTVGLTFNMGGSATIPANNSFDIFVTLNAGVPVLAAAQWSTPTSRTPAISLSVFGGMLTNSSNLTMRINPSVTISVNANQATFLGSFYTTGNGVTPFQYGASASGGNPATFGICNYYNKVSFNTVVTDTGAPYTYTANTVRQARNSPGNQIVYVQSDSERAAHFSYLSQNVFAATAAAGISTGIGFNSSSAYNSFFLSQNQGSLAFNLTGLSTFMVASTGLATAFACEASDGTHASTFCASPGNLLIGNIWL